MLVRFEGTLSMSPSACSCWALAMRDEATGSQLNVISDHADCSTLASRLLPPSLASSWLTTVAACDAFSWMNRIESTFPFTRFLITSGCAERYPLDTSRFVG